MCTVTEREALIERWEQGLSFTPPFYMCCSLVLDPKVNSPEYIQSVLTSMRCCRQASILLSDLLKIPGIEAVRFMYGKIGVAPLATADRETLHRAITEVINRHLNRD